MILTSPKMASANTLSAKVGTLEYEKLLILQKQLHEKAKTNFKAFVLATYPNYKLNWHHSLTMRYLQAFSEGKIKKLIINMPPQHGKALAHTTPILTSKGWSKHGLLKPGDEVYTPAGTLTKVLKVSEDFVMDYEITIGSDVTRCHSAHEWEVFWQIDSVWKKGLMITKTISNIMKYPEDRINQHYGPLYARRLRVIEFPKADLDIPPYLMGLWLGSIHKKEFVLRLEEKKIKPTSVDDERNDNDTSYREKVEKYLTKRKINYKIVAVTKENNPVTYLEIPEYTPLLADHHLNRHRHIAKNYLFSSVSQRNQILAGLIDSGILRVIVEPMKDEEPVFELYLQDKFLAPSLRAMLISLGMDTVKTSPISPYSPKWFQKSGKKTVISFQNRQNLPSIKHKLPFIACENEFVLQRITKCTESDTKTLGKCIHVKDLDRLYCFGRNHTATHNSELVSRMLPAFALGMNPDLRVVSTTYAADFAKKFNRDVQRIIKLPEYKEIFPDTRVNRKGGSSKDDEVNNAMQFEIIGHHGFYQATSSGTPLTGFTVDMGIIDDPVKDRAEAESKAYRDSIWDWYTDVFQTRLHNDSQELITMTRWHEDDLVGRILAVEPDKWKTLILPAIFDPEMKHVKDPRTEGQALWEERHSREKILSLKKKSPRNFYSMQQQQPSPEDGDIVKKDWWRFWKELPENWDDAVFSWDCAFKDGKENDWVVGEAWVAKGPNRYLLDEMRGHWDFTQTLIQIEALMKKYPKIRKCLIEDKANGSAIISVIRKVKQGIIAVNPTDSKEGRARAISIQIESGNVYLPMQDTNPWVHDYINEWSKFPNGRNDDRVDATSQALFYLQKETDEIGFQIMSFTKPSKFYNSNIAV